MDRIVKELEEIDPNVSLFQEGTVLKVFLRIQNTQDLEKRIRGIVAKHEPKWQVRVLRSVQV